MSAEKLTGRRRYRTEGRFLREPLLVLQVEVATFRYENCGSYIDAEPVTIWRDARSADLTETEATL